MVAEIGVFLLMPRLLRQVPVRRVLLCCHGIATVRFVLIGWQVEVLPLVVLAQLMHGATFGAAHATCVATLNRCFPAAQQGRAHSLYSSLSFGAGGVVGGLLAGYLWQGWGGGLCYTVAALFAAAGGVLIWRWMGSSFAARTGSAASGGMT